MNRELLPYLKTARMACRCARDAGWQAADDEPGYHHTLLKLDELIAAIPDVEYDGHETSEDRRVRRAENGHNE